MQDRWNAELVEKIVPTPWSLRTREAPVRVELDEAAEVDVEDGEVAHRVARLRREEQAEHAREQREHLRNHLGEVFVRNLLHSTVLHFGIKFLAELGSNYYQSMELF